MKAFSIAILVLAASSCTYFFPEEMGEIDVAFSKDFYLATKSRESLPDTNDFYLKVSSAKGTLLYSGPYGAAPQPLLAAPGAYEVEVRSSESTAPAFSSPVYGDRRSVEVLASQSVCAEMLCSQVNAGIRLVYSSSLTHRYPGASLILSSEDGSLSYPQGETRIAYFNPGTVNLLLDDGQQLRELASRVLKEREILTLEVDAAEPAQGGISVVVDTSRSWLSDRLLVDGPVSGRGTDISDALSVSEARNMAGASDVWVYGYVVGGDLSSSKASFAPPFSSKTNIVLAGKSSCSSRDMCLAVQLRQGDIRDALNLVDNPGMLGRQVFLKGNLVASYYGMPGIQALTDCELRGE